MNNVVMAAGTVTLRESDGHREVLAVHRPRYGDWSLPKGKLNAQELAPVAAVRETLEETGVSVRLGRPLGIRSYPVDKKTKIVDWWIGHPLSISKHKPDGEVDQVEWIEVEEALRRLNHEDERAVLEQALGVDAGSTMLIVRHAKAITRKRFKGSDDSKREINREGKKQARALINLLSAYGVRYLISSPSTRCVQTFLPFSKRDKIPIKTVDLLSEENGKDRSQQVRGYLAKLRLRIAARPDDVMAICGHRPVLPDMLYASNLAARALEVAECLVVHLDSDGETWAVENHTPLT